MLFIHRSNFSILVKFVRLTDHFVQYRGDIYTEYALSISDIVVTLTNTRLARHYSEEVTAQLIAERCDLSPS